MFGTLTPDLPSTATALDDLTVTPTPSNLVCVCCNCDRIRSRTGEWRDDQTPVPGDRRTHGICPDCFVDLYPEYAALVEAR